MFCPLDIVSLVTWLGLCVRVSVTSQTLVTEHNRSVCSTSIGCQYPARQSSQHVDQSETFFHLMVILLILVMLLVLTQILMCSLMRRCETLDQILVLYAIISPCFQTEFLVGIISHKTIAGSKQGNHSALYLVTYLIYGWLKPLC